jgi:hypothetical protein
MCHQIRHRNCAVAEIVDEYAASKVFIVPIRFNLITAELQSIGPENAPLYKDWRKLPKQSSLCTLAHVSTTVPMTIKAMNSL